MGKLLGLLKSVEKSLHSRWGAWAQAVSKELDSLSAASTPGYIQAKNNALQAGVTTGTNILVQTTIANSGIDRAGGISEMEFELEAGKTYHLLAHGSALNFSDANDGQLSIRWVNGSDQAIPQSDAPAALWRTVTDDSALSGDSVTDAIYEVPAAATLAERRVHLRCNAATGTADIPSNGVTVTIIEIA